MKREVVVYTLVGTLLIDGAIAHADSCAWDSKCKNGIPSEHARHPHIESSTTATNSTAWAQWPITYVTTTVQRST